LSYKASRQWASTWHAPLESCLLRWLRSDAQETRKSRSLGSVPT
jgi:hypothetical protein